MTSVQQQSLRDPEADGASLKWEDFFGQTNSDDLLPCLLGVYDSIAGKGLRKDVAVGSDDDHVAIVQSQWRQSRNLESLAEESKRQYASAVDEAPKKQLTRSESLKHGRQRPSSLASEMSSSSLSSAVSIGISSCCSSGSDLSDAIRLHQCHFVNKPTSCYLASEESLAEELHHQEEAKKKHCSNRMHIPRVTTTTSSQYSEDSGVFSSLQRSESVKGERSYSYETNLDYTTKVILEIIETETVYVNDLRQIIEGYLDEWKNNPNCYLTDEQINDLFSNIEEIYDFSRCFLWELEQCGVNPVNIARCFVQNNSNFSIYATYCTNYPRSVSVLTELMRQEKTACIFRDRQMSLQHTLPLGSYLLKPVQRILKYHLLLQNMVKHSSSDSVGYNDVTVALSTMTGIAHHINNMKRKHEHAVRVQEVQSLLIGWQGPDLVVFGELYAEGTFRISGARALRHIFLFEHMLLVTKKKEGGVLHYKTHIICSNLMLVECLPKEPLSFQIIPFDNPRLQLTVHARSLEEKRHWALELKRVILENYNVEIPSHARQLVMELGQVQHLADNLSLNKILHRRQHSTPEYLEKRRTTRKNRKKTLRSHLAPLIRKSDLLGHKIQNKFKKSHSNEDSLLSSTSVNSLDDGVDSDSQDKVSFNSIATNERDVGDRSDELFNGSPTIIRRMSYSFTNGDNADDVNYISKEKAIEEIIGQLIMENKKFQQAIKSQENDLSSFGNHSSGDDAAYENRLRDILKQIRDDRRPDSIKSLQDDGLDYIEDDYEASLSSSSKLESSYSSSSAASNSAAVDSNLSASLNTLIPTSPIVWLKQQDQHLAAPSKKADSLPRTFQISADDCWKTNRPKTIASDKPQQIKDFAAIAIEDGTECSNSCLMLAKAAANDNGKSLTGSSSDTTPHHSLHNLNVHPECKFYRTSVTTRLTLMKMMNNLSAKISSLKLQLDEHQYHQPSGGNSGSANCYSNGRSNDSGAGAHRDGKFSHGRDRKDNLSTLLLSATGYRQGSSKLGARIAKCTELSDYADPRVLFPTITPSKKAASILGIRPFSPQSITNDDTTDGKQADVHQSSEHCCAGSDCSADSFYEHKFEEVEKLFLNGDSLMESRRNSLLFDFDEPPTDRTIKFSRRSYAHLLTPNITVHKPIRIPPPVPIKPKTVKLIPNTKRFTVVELKKQINDGDQLTVLESSSLPTRGWVKQVVNKIQAAGVVD